MLYYVYDPLTYTSFAIAQPQVLSLRFYDGSAVSVSEFLEFFSLSEAARTAKAAAAAVRLSLNALEIEGVNKV